MNEDGDCQCTDGRDQNSNGICAYVNKTGVVNEIYFSLLPVVLVIVGFLFFWYYGKRHFRPLPYFEV